MSDEPLAVGPNVIILDIFGEHAGEEIGFGGRHGGDMGHDHLAVVPARSVNFSPLAIGGLWQVHQFESS